MRVESIKIENYRCFENLNLSFGKQATVIIGKNGTGKSSLISAIRKGLSFIFSKNQDFEHNLHTSSNSNIRGFEFWDSRFDSIARSFKYPMSVSLTGFFPHLPKLEWSLFKDSSNGKFRSTLYKKAQGEILKHYNLNTESASLPVLAFYSDSYPHILSNVGSVAKQIISKDIVPRDFGYYGWDDQTNCMELWLIRYKKASGYIRDHQAELERIEEQIRIQQNNEQDSDDNITKLNERLIFIKNDKRIVEFKAELEYIERKIIAVTASSGNEQSFVNEQIQIVRMISNKPSEDVNDSIEFLFADGRSIFFEMLPQGYKRLLSITFDIAYRSYILNKSQEPYGIVFIDEIELHLHPSLQQEVLQRFMHVFPNIQFITTTHSPLILSNLMVDDDNIKLLKLTNHGNDYDKEMLESVYGIDYETNLSDVMGVAPRSTTIQKFINAYLFLYNKDKKEEANSILDKLKVYLGGKIPPLLQKEIDNQKASS